MLQFISTLPLIHKPIGEEVAHKQKIADAKKEMEESGYYLTFAFVIMALVFILRKYVFKT